MVTAKIGVFDSGIGGKSIAGRLQADFLYAEIIYAYDKANVPYGSKTYHEILRLVDAAIQPLIAAGCDVIVLACTLFHWIKAEIIGYARGKATVIDPSDAVSLRLRGILDARR